MTYKARLISNALSSHKETGFMEALDIENHRKLKTNVSAEKSNQEIIIEFVIIKQSP